ncbi:MAG: NPCBM/NEW2 domain-containing protein [Planctomycetaceae bacterium]
MIRAGPLLMALAAAAGAAPSVSLLDGRIQEVRLLGADAGTLHLLLPAGAWSVPARNVAALELQPGSAQTSRASLNLFLRNGDIVRGTVKGEGTFLSLEGPGITGLKVPLREVVGVRYGRLLGTAQDAYDAMFQTLLERGRDSVLVQRDANPFPIDARVLEVTEGAMRVRIGDSEHDLPDAHRVYGFVLRPDTDPPPPPPGLRIRLLLAGGGRITLPLERITEEAIEGGGARIALERAARIEFLGEHVAALGDFEPIGVREVAAFGAAAPWRRDGMVHGGPLRLGDRRYESGLGVRAYSRLEFAIGRRWRSFFARCGIDDAAGPEGEALFRVLGDGRLLAEVRRKRGDPPALLGLDVEGVERLVLEVDPAGSYASDFCDWTDARLFNAAPMPPAPGG